jgi:plasmid stabilization system protein ParE
MKRYILTPRAKRDVNDIWDYIASDNVEAADRVLDALESAMPPSSEVRAPVATAWSISRSIRSTR